MTPTTEIPQAPAALEAAAAAHERIAAHFRALAELLTPPTERQLDWMRDLDEARRG